MVEYQSMGMSRESLQLNPSSMVLFGKDASYFQAENMGLRIGVEVTPVQANMYCKLRGEPMNGEVIKSDQVIMAEVLEETGGPVEIFKQSYPNIFPPEIVKES